MRLYKVSMVGDFGDCDGRSFWTSRKSDIDDLKERLRADCLDAASRPEPMVETIEFETSVSGILKMLNRHADRG